MADNVSNTPGTPGEPLQPTPASIVTPAIQNRETVLTGEAPYPAGTTRHVMWSAIFAGLFVALVVQLSLSLLGLGIGLVSFSPSQGSEGSSAAVGSVIWVLITTLLALFAAGWVAGRVAGIPRALDSTMHGILTWSVATVVTFLLLSSALGQIAGLAATSVTQAMSAAASNPHISRQAMQMMTQDPSQTEQQIRQQARQLTRQGGAADQQNQQAINQELDRLFQQTRQTGQAPDTAQLTSALQQSTNLSQSEAQQMVDRWARQYEQAVTQQVSTEQGGSQQGQLPQTQNAAGQSGSPSSQKMAARAERAAGAVGRAAIWGFVSLLLGAGSAALGGYLATPDDQRSTTRRAR